MCTNARKWTILAVLLGLGLSLGGVFSSPSPTYAAQDTPLQTTTRQLQNIEDLSAAFRAVAKAVKPSVVSIRVKTYRPRSIAPHVRPRPSPSSPSPHPEGPEWEEFRRKLREYFGPDFDFKLPPNPSNPSPRPRAQGQEP